MTLDEKFQQVNNEVARYYLSVAEQVVDQPGIAEQDQPELAQILAVNAAFNDDYPRGWAACRADDEASVEAIEEACSQAEYAYWQERVTVNGTTYLLAFEYGD